MDTCVRCARTIGKTEVHYLCDQTGTLCANCWEIVGDLCLMIHGEGCKTAVFPTEEQEPS